MFVCARVRACVCKRERERERGREREREREYREAKNKKPGSKKILFLDFPVAEATAKPR